MSCDPFWMIKNHFWRIKDPFWMIKGAFWMLKGAFWMIKAWLIEYHIQTGWLPTWLFHWVRILTHQIPCPDSSSLDAFLRWMPKTSLSGYIFLLHQWQHDLPAPMLTKTFLLHKWWHHLPKPKHSQGPFFTNDNKQTTFFVEPMLTTSLPWCYHCFLLLCQYQHSPPPCPNAYKDHSLLHQWQYNLPTPQ